jgi:spermidine synthase
VRELKEAGRVSGRIYAVSTWGSLLGTYLPVLVTIPLAGSRLTALGFGTLLLLVGVGGLWRVRPRTGSVAGVTALLLLLPTAVIGTRGGIKDYEGQLFETESSYNYVQVIRRQDCNYLLLNEGQAYHSYYCDGGRVPRISVWSIMLAAPYFNQSVGNIDSMAVIGLAAGTIAKQFTQLYGPIPIDGIEIDSEIIRAGRDYFGLEEPNINVIVGDGRYELSRLDTAYNVITIDAYKVPYIPWHLTTREFFQEVRRHLNSEDGVVAINVGRVPDDRALVNALAATLTTVFPSVHGVDVPGSLNTILVATVQPTASDNLIANLARMPPDADPLLRSAVTTAAAHLVKIEPGDIIFTDQRAPVEIMTDAIVVRYLLREGPAGLPGLAQ